MMKIFRALKPMNGATSYEWQFGWVHIRYCHLTGGAYYKSMFNVYKRLSISDVRKYNGGRQ